MEGLAGYGGSSSEEEEGAIQQWGGPRPAVNLAPQVDVTAETEFRAYVDPSAKTVATNPTFEALSQPVQGPKHPFNRSGSLSKAQMNLANGNLEVAGISAYSFDELLHTFGGPPAHTAARWRGRSRAPGMRRASDSELLGGMTASRSPQVTRVGHASSASCFVLLKRPMAASWPCIPAEVRCVCTKAALNCAAHGTRRGVVSRAAGGVCPRFKRA